MLIYSHGNLTYLDLLGQICITKPLVLTKQVICQLESLVMCVWYMITTLTIATA